MPEKRIFSAKVTVPPEARATANRKKRDSFASIIFSAPRGQTDRVIADEHVLGPRIERPQAAERVYACSCRVRRPGLLLENIIIANRSHSSPLQDAIRAGPARAPEKMWKNKGDNG